MAIVTRSARKEAVTYKAIILAILSPDTITEPVYGQFLDYTLNLYLVLTNYVDL